MNASSTVLRPLPFSHCFPDSGLVAKAKDGLMEQDALVNSWLALDSDNESQCDGSVDPWCQDLPAKECSKGSSLGASSASTQSALAQALSSAASSLEPVSILATFRHLNTEDQSPSPVSSQGVKRASSTGLEANSDLKKAKTEPVKTAVPMTLVHQPRPGLRILAAACPASQGLTAHPAKPSSVSQPIYAGIAPPVSLPGLSQVSFGSGTTSPGGSPAGSAATNVTAPHMALCPSSSPQPTWHFAPGLAGALVPFPGLKAEPASPVSPILSHASPHPAGKGVLPWTGARPMIPTPSAPAPVNPDEVPEALQRAIAEALQQPTQTPPLGLKLDTAALADQLRGLPLSAPQ